MDPKEQAAEQSHSKEEEHWIEENWEEKEAEQQQVGEEKPAEKAAPKLKQEPRKGPTMLYFGPKHEADRAIFVNGLSVGLGIGCIVTFVVMWIAVFFTPQLPVGATYQDLLSIFIYPLIYLLATGLITLTAGIVREYYTAKFKT
jgi:hypothetical protein